LVTFAVSVKLRLRLDGVVP
jgi:hypothetical protein